MSIRANTYLPPGDWASRLRRADFPLPGLLLCLALIFSAATNAHAGWDVGNQRATDGHVTVAGELLPEAASDSSAGQEEAPASTANNDDVDGYARGDWSLGFGLEDQIFPAAIIALSTLDPRDIGVRQSENTFGSPLAMASVFVRALNAGDRITIEISSTKLIKPSRMTVVLPDTETVYEISPHLKYEYEKLLGVRQPYPEDVTAKVIVNGQLVGEKTKTVIVRSVNDCFFGTYLNEGREFQDWTEMFAAYVNEGDPVVDEILGEALRKGYVEAFIGYQGEEQDLAFQLDAIWRVLQDKGVRYSSITTTSVESDTVATQHVRLVGDSTRGGQANCVDGSVLLASVFRKIGLDAYLILLPGHMMVGVSSSEEKDAQIVPIETTLLSSADLGQAMDSGFSTAEKYKDDLTYISVNGAREAGILPLRNLYK
jgi:hypothetical protein